MISRRDNILKRPWEERKYENHRRKVQSAAPVIDNKPPPERLHVNLKLKKQQKERERCQKIERDNFLLLKKLSYLMRSNKVDNWWKTPQPNFLNKIAMYEMPAAKLRDDFYIDERKLREDLQVCTKQTKCFACDPYETNLVMIPEERVPWEPANQSISRRRSKSVPVRKPEYPPVDKKERPKTIEVSSKSRKASRSLKPKEEKVEEKLKPKSLEKNRLLTTEPKLVIKRGGLHVDVNFPSDTMVKFYNNHQEKTLMPSLCNCKMIKMVQTY